MAEPAPGAASAERQVTGWLGRAGVLPVLTVTDPRTVEPACLALAAGGVTCVEITFRTSCAAEAITIASGVPGMLVGAGTVTDPAQAAAAAGAGASFAVAPGLSEPVIAAARAAGLAFFPGIATPSELDRAGSLGCAVVKVFPVTQLGGPAFLRAIAAPYPGARFLPTGGISGATLGDYLALPSVLACGASWLCEPGLLADGRYDEITRRALAATAVAREAKRAGR